METAAQVVEVILQTYTVVGLAGLAALGLALLVAAIRRPESVTLQAPDAWKTYRFGYATYALIFVAFDMEMIFMYPWAVCSPTSG